MRRVATGCAVRPARRRAPPWRRSTSQPRPASQRPSAAELRREVVVDEEDARRAAPSRCRQDATSRRARGRATRAPIASADPGDRPEPGQRRRRGGASTAASAASIRAWTSSRRCSISASSSPASGGSLAQPADAPRRSARASRRSGVASASPPPARRSSQAAPSAARAVAETVNSNPGSQRRVELAGEAVAARSRRRRARGRLRVPVGAHRGDEPRPRGGSRPRPPRALSARSIAQPAMRSGAHARRAPRRRRGPGSANRRGGGSSGWDASGIGSPAAALIDLLRQRGLTPCERAVARGAGIAANCRAPLVLARRALVLRPRPRRAGRPAGDRRARDGLRLGERGAARTGTSRTPRPVPGAAPTAWSTSSPEPRRAAPSVGPDLDAAAPATAPSSTAARGADDPGAYDDRAWIHAT